MEAYLIIDQGNTTTKMSIYTSDGTLIQNDTVNSLSHGALINFISDRPITAAIYSSVGDTPADLHRWLADITPLVIALNASTPCPLVLDYFTPDTLGSDRLAAAVGAYCIPECHNRDILVVDMGTAITYDRVNATGVYSGGNIAPGIALRLKALSSFTARLPIINREDIAQHYTTVWGKTTTSAMVAGAVRGVVAEIEYYRSISPKDTAVVITGGDAELFADLLPKTFIVRRDLVAFGLFNIIRRIADPLSA